LLRPHKHLLYYPQRCNCADLRFGGNDKDFLSSIPCTSGSRGA